MADHPHGGITMDECSRLNLEIGDILEEGNVIQSHYILEVCSPGLDRPLRTGKDFNRCIYRAVKCFLNEPISGKIEWDGVITGVSDIDVSLETAQGILKVPLDKISKAKQII